MTTDPRPTSYDTLTPQLQYIDATGALVAIPLPVGPAGTQMIYGSGAPGGGTGNNGDTYIDNVANFLYGPKAAGVWPSGVSLIGPTGAGLASYDSVSALRAETSPPATILLRGYAALGDSPPRILIWNSSDTTTDNDGTIFKLTSVATGRYNFVNPGYVFAEWFGAVNGRSSDNSAAVQKAVNYCLGFSEALPLRVATSLLITSSVNIDRVVDTTTSRFRIIGQGAGAGFYTNTAVTIFDSTLTVTTDPRSENIGFEGVHFEGATASTAAYCISGKFLRVYFDGACHWQKMKLINASIYAQSWYIDDGATAIAWDGTFFNADGAFDINVGALRREASTGIFMDLTGSASGTVGVNIKGGVFEGSTGPFFQSDREQRVSISGVYFEGNTNPDIKFGLGGHGGSGIAVRDCNFYNTSTNKANSSFYNIDWGNAAGGVSTGNLCDSRLHDTDSMTGYLINGGADIATTTLYKDETKVSDSETGWITYTPSLISGTGTLTTKSATGKYKRICGKTIFFQATATITTNGTGATNIQIGLPTTAAAPSNVCGDEIAATGKTLSGTIIAASANTVMLNYDATYPGGSGKVLQVSGFYESST